jgi:hypothetical protein
VSGNSADTGGGIDNGTLTSHTTVSDSIVAGNLSGGNCDRPVTDGGYNLEDDTGASCGFSGANHSLAGTDPMLDSAGPQLNGAPAGAPATIALESGSPAIDAIPAPCAVTIYEVDGSTLTQNADERGVTRPQGPACDIGAYEARAAVASRPVPSITSISPTGASVGAGDTTLTVTGTNFVAASVVRINGTALATDASDAAAGTLTVTLPANALTGIATDQITVFTPPSSSGGSDGGGDVRLRSGRSLSGGRRRLLRHLRAPRATSSAR